VPKLHPSVPVYFEQLASFTTIAVTSCAMTTHSLAADGTCMFLTSGFAAAVSGNFFLSVALLFCSLIQLEASLGNNSWIVFQRSHSLWNCFVQVPLQKKICQKKLLLLFASTAQIRPPVMVAN
jgi:hypothetical protein